MTYSLPKDLASVPNEKGDSIEVFLARMPHGEPAMLTASAAVIWSAAVELGEPAEIIPAVAEAFGVEGSAIEDEVHHFLAHLVERGLLCET